MSVVRRRVLPLVGAAALAKAIPQHAPALDSATGTAVKLAMGPTSAPLKSSGAPPPSDNSAPKPRHHLKHRPVSPAPPK